MVNVHENNRILSSLPLHILLYFNIWYDVLYVLINIIVFIYKGQALPYPPTRFGWELSFVFFFIIIEACRIYQGRWACLYMMIIARNIRVSIATKGNKTEQIAPIIWSVSISIPVVVLAVYFVSLQTYV